jgi:hypothetical protein
MRELLLRRRDGGDVIKLGRPSTADERAGGVEGEEIVAGALARDGLVRRDEAVADRQRRDEQGDGETGLPESFAQLRRRRERVMREFDASISTRGDASLASFAFKARYRSFTP